MFFSVGGQLFLANDDPPGIDPPSPKTAVTALEAGMVSIIARDASLRRALLRFVVSLGMKAKAFASTRELLPAGDLPNPAGIVILHAAEGTEEASYLSQFTQKTAARVIMLIENEDPRLWATLKETGAFDVFAIPFPPRRLLHALGKAMNRTSSLTSEKTARFG